MNKHSINTAAAAHIETPLMATASEPGTDLFVINLCASMTPMPSVPKHLKGFERYKLYQVSKMEDGRRRYRLRLGFFTSEADAELIVGSIRSLYPAAFTACLSNEDLRYTESFAPRSAAAAVKSVQTDTHAPRPVEIPLQNSLAQPARHSNQLTAVEVPAAVPRTPAVTPAKTPAKASEAAVAEETPPVAVHTATKKAAVEPELSLEIDLRDTAASAVLPPGLAPKADVVPFHVSKGIQVPDVALELEPETRPAQAAKAVPTVQPTTADTRPTQPVAPKAVAGAKPAVADKPAAAVVREPLPPPPQIIEDYIPVLDTTLTIRTLTQTEIDDPNQPKWYVVQLALSDHPVNLDAMPKLDIFSAYSVYSVAITTGGTIRHALRLGFFREDVSAEAVSGYLKTFFPSPTITRVSAAEHSRFAEPPRKPGAPAGTADKIVPLKRTALPKTAAVATKPATAPAQTPVTTNPASPYAKITKAAGKPPAKGGTATKSLTMQLKEEARQTLLAESGIRKAPKSQSFLSRLIGRSLD